MNNRFGGYELCSCTKNHAREAYLLILVAVGLKILAQPSHLLVSVGAQDLESSRYRLTTFWLCL